ncbi:hypothetical protein BT96DRAFT_917131 [Gymnopus androsaceus JB14]|uniref:GH16 domain-containing protein n=1 Tax=Gymnopus androsaceus JB14 TaxID=1447944 RepID=A0A6A4I469_9AGAR|nr:hypothetical protein BT96DRAFT_917131 [Gymnopus androsaceus JB14]
MDKNKAASSFPLPLAAMIQPTAFTLGYVFTTFAMTTLAQTYTISQNLSGSNFFEGFKYNESAIDYSNYGNVHFLSEADAVAANLTYVDSEGHVIIKVDNSTNAVGDESYGRNSVYLESTTTMTYGSLLVFDANHIPYGCSVWPSLFTQGQNWPAQGELDIIENVNLATVNQYSLHVGSTACNQPTSATSNQTGSTTSSNCTVNTGCVVVENQPNTFGAGFANNGGGVYAVLWDESGIAFWFFNRSVAPADVSSSSPDPSSWTTPSGDFGPQIITLYIDICGAFAGDTTVFDETCSSVAPNCTSLVQTASNYDDAYWEINYLRVFSTGNATTTSSGSSSASATSTSSSSNDACAVTIHIALLATVFLGILTMTL